MARRISTSVVRGGWQLSDDNPGGFYEGATVIASHVTTSDLCQAIRDRIVQRLNRRVRDLEVEVTTQGVVLSGICTSFHAKQLAQHEARELSDRPLENRIQVAAS
ncbi:BON domain-containing protein [Aeoliella sp.]|uniref:BON domain-containing protein n=1 Tax=Aeoliella sp. TaxID=2795800 RepID=UPI003CCC04EB